MGWEGDEKRKQWRRQTAAHEQAALRFALSPRPRRAAWLLAGWRAGLGWLAWVLFGVGEVLKSGLEAARAPAQWLVTASGYLHAG